MDEGPTALEVVGGLAEAYPTIRPMGQSTTRRKHQPHTRHVAQWPFFGSSHVFKPHLRIFWELRLGTVG